MTARGLSLSLVVLFSGAAPLLAAGRSLVSKSLGGSLDHPIYGIDIAAVCKK